MKKGKAIIIMGVIDILLVVMVIGMLVFGAVQGRKAESRVDADKVLRESGETEKEKIYTQAVEEEITFSADKTPESSTKEEDSSAEESNTYNGNVEEDVKAIRADWQTIQDNLNNYKVTDAGNGVKQYSETVGGADVIKKAVVKNGGTTEEYFYYYENGSYEVFFAFVTDADQREDRYYFVDDQLIRWIEAKKGGTTHDMETENEEYTRRGTEYLSKAITAIGL